MFSVSKVIQKIPNEQNNGCLSFSSYVPPKIIHKLLPGDVKFD